MSNTAAHRRAWTINPTTKARAPTGAPGRILFEEQHDARFHHRDHLLPAGVPAAHLCGRHAGSRLAIADTDWSGQKEDYESSGETYVTGIWQGAEAAYRGTVTPVPQHFGETVQRQAAHFELMLGLLKIMVGDAQAGRSTSPEWLGKAEWAIARGEAVLAGARGPDEPAPDGGHSDA